MRTPPLNNSNSCRRRLRTPHWPQRGLLSIALLLSAACSEPTEKPEASPKWQLVFDDLDTTLFSVWGTDSSDIWAVGADGGDGSTVLHYDGDVWRRLDPGTTGTLWWVFGRGDDIWMSGDDGLIVRYSRSEERFERQPKLGDSILFGIFPVAEDDVWAVGGDFEGGDTVIYRFDGEAWTELGGIPEDAQESPLFKVWGRASDDIWLVGFGSTILHYDGDDLEPFATPTGRRLFTVHGNDNYTAAVGGFVDGLLVENDGDEWADVTPGRIEQLNGIWVLEDDTAVAVGNAGTIWNRSADGEWTSVKDVPDTFDDYHAVFVDESGGEWAVGGQIVAPPYEPGMLAYRGEREISAEILK